MKKTGNVHTAIFPCDWTMLIARLFLVAIFAYSLFGKVMDFSGTAGYISSTGLPFPELLTIAAIVLELVGVVSLVLGYRMHIGAIVLVIYTVAATLMFHIGPGQMLAFLKNLGLIGGLLLLVGTSPGKYSVDGSKKAKKSKK